MAYPINQPYQPLPLPYGLPASTKGNNNPTNDVTPINNPTPPTPVASTHPTNTKNKPFPWLATLLGIGGLTVVTFGTVALINHLKKPAEASKVTSKNQTTLQAMHRVFAEASDFLPYQINLLTPSKAVEVKAKPSLLESLSNFFSRNPTPPAVGYLQAVDQLKTADNIYLGDLHGAWEKALQHLAMAEMIQMPEATAQKFISIHQELETAYASNANLETINGLVHQFKTALSQIEVVDDGRGIHLIGDIVGDRGQNDILTLLLLDHCKDKIKSRVFSNHDLAAIETYQRAFYYPNIQIEIQGDGQTESALRAFELANANIPNKAVDLNQLKTLYENHFKQLELLHYDEQTETLSLHQAFKPEKVHQILAAYIADEEKKKALFNQFESGDKQAYKEAVDTLNKQFKACVADKWLKGDNQSIKDQLKWFYSDIWYGDARRDFIKIALPQDEGFPFYNANAVKNIAFGHEYGKAPVVKASLLEGSPVFYLLDQGACKLGASANEQFSRLFVPALANPPQPLSTVA